MGLSAPWVKSLVIIAFQRVKIIIGINQMGLSLPWYDSLDIISLDPVNINYQGLTQCALVPLGPNILILLPFSQLKNDEGLTQFYLVPLGLTLLILLPYRQKHKVIGINPIGLIAPRDDSRVIIDLHTLNQIARDQPSIYTGVIELVTNRQHYDIKHPQNIYQLES